ncbi:MAG: UbiA family prenyltransferase [Aureispira sp.]
MKNIFGMVWQLLRGTNLILLAISLSLLLLKAQIELTVYEWIALLWGTMSIAAAGNLVNDIMDQAIDEINEAERRIVGVKITEKVAWSGYWILNSVALCLAFGTKNIGLCSCYGSSILLLWAYSRFFKCRAWLGNLVVAFLCALALLQLLFLAPVQWNRYWQGAIVLYASFAFLTNWWRELIKDIEDEQGDRQNACSTLIVQHGMPYGLKIAHYFCNALLLWLVLLLGLLWGRAPFGAWLYVLLVLFPIAIFLKNRLGRLTNRTQMHQFSQGLKGYMLLGLIGILFL